MLIPILLVVAGLALLATAPDRFVHGAATLAGKLGMSTVVIGAVVIGFGTSAPELLVSGLAAASGEPEIGIGNVVGSNIANLTLVLGCAGLFARLQMPGAVVRREMPLAMAATLLFAVLVGNGLDRVEGAVLVIGLVAALGWMIARGRAMPADEDPLAGEAEEYLEHARRPPMRIGLEVAGGLLGTVIGAQMLVTGAVDLAAELGLSDGFVGLTLVAVGTSLPELLTAVAAARQGEHQLIIGNLLGSNLFNSLAVGGTIGLVGPAVVTDATLTVTAVLLMVATSILGVWAMVTSQRVRRYEGAILLGAWVITLPLLA